MNKRIELHNHTIESDGKMTVKELVSYLKTCSIHNFSLTDHNTISGHKKLKSLFTTEKIDMEYLTGYELTSYFGHILCQNITSYIPWDDIDKDNADMIFERVHQQGGLAGIAHPNSAPAPLSNGMGFAMKIHNPELMDFMEIINNAHRMIPDNSKGILWWENLIFEGYHISPVSGTDLHAPRNMKGLFTTYLQFPINLQQASLSKQFAYSISHCSTCVTKGPIIEYSLLGFMLTITLSYENDGFSDQYFTCEDFYINIKSQIGNILVPIKQSVSLTIKNLLSQSGNNTLLTELYCGQMSYDNLVAIGAPIFY